MIGSIPHRRASRGAAGASAPRHNTGSETRRAASVPVSARSMRTSSSTGPTLASAGRRFAATSAIASPSSTGWRVRACLPSRSSGPLRRPRIATTWNWQPHGRLARLRRHCADRATRAQEDRVGGADPGPTEHNVSLTPAQSSDMPAATSPHESAGLGYRDLLGPAPSEPAASATPTPTAADTMRS